MKLLFVKATKPGSKLIRWCLKTDCSHFAICFDEDKSGQGIVFHSYGKGPQLAWLGSFIKHNEIVHALTFGNPMTLEYEEAIYKGVIGKYDGQWYDYAALFWWAWRGFLFRFFGIPFTAKNNWAQNGFSLCTGIASGIPEIKAYCEKNCIDLEMIRPHDLKDLLISKLGYVESSDWAKATNSLNW